MSYTDPAYIGPGYWVSWHIKSLKSDTLNKKRETARSIAIDISGFPCLKCKQHSISYVKEHPLLKSVESKDPLSMFNWTVDFHNAVNERLDKKLMNAEEANMLYSGKLNICLEGCDEEGNISDENISKLKVTFNTN